MCNVLRNSEGIEDLELKKEAYNAIVKYNIVYTILYSQWVIRYVLEHQKLPPSIPAQISLLEITENLPFHIQSSLQHHLGTNKLSQVILSKIELDKTGHSVTGSDLEAYFSVTLYADVLGHGFEKILKTFIKDVKNFSVQNYLLFKLKKYFYKRTRPGSDNEEMYLDLISELQIRAQKLPKRLKETLKKIYLIKKRN